jgi:uncharacterized membrane protein
MDEEPRWVVILGNVEVALFGTWRRFVATVLAVLSIVMVFSPTVRHFVVQTVIELLIAAIILFGGYSLLRSFTRPFKGKK